MKGNRSVYVLAAIVAAIVAALTTGGPAIAHGVRHALFAHNADKVDGRHAVGALATRTNRRGKLVATNASTGFLPNNIIQKAPDSNLLDGLDSTAFLGAGAKATDAELLDGLNSTEIVQGGGTVGREYRLLSPGQQASVTTPFSTVSYSCPTPLTGSGTLAYTNTFGGLAPVWIDNGGTTSYQRAGGGAVTTATAVGGNHITIGAVHQQLPDLTVVVEAFISQDLTFGVCDVYLQVVSS